MSARRDDIPSEFEAMRTPPHSVEAEQAVLGGLLLDNGTWEQAADAVSAEDFYRQDHRLIFQAIKSMAEASQPFDAVTVSERLHSLGKLEQAGGLAHIATITRDTPTSANVRAYAAIVRERSVYRHLIRLSGTLAEAAYAPAGRSPAELIELAEREVFALAEGAQRSQKGAAQLGTLLPAAVNKLDALLHADSHITGLPTGLTKLDEMTAGLQPGDLIIIAGRPSMGKTALAVNIARHTAVDLGKTAAIFSMEMSAQQLLMRVVSDVGRIDQQRLRTGKLDDTDWKRLAGCMDRLSKAPLFIDDTGGLSPTELRARARRLKRSDDIQLLVVDYLQLMQVPGTRENRATEISEICRNLKALAKELDIPVIALSQLNRKLEERPDKRPIMSDLRESGSIEQDADLILMLYRDEVYDDESEDRGIAEVDVAKQRNGPTGPVRTTFLGQFTRFENLAFEEPR